jgi:hypothetical protein
MLRPHPSRKGEPDSWTTPCCLRIALIRHVLPLLPSIPTIWEPAAGSCELVRDLRAAGFTVTATDAFDPVHPVDFLHAAPRTSTPPLLITNPPYNALGAWIQHALSLLDTGALAGVVLLLRGDHLGAQCRATQLNRASHLVMCCWRPRWIPGSTTSPRFWFSWVIWLPYHQGGPVTTWLTRKDVGQIDGVGVVTQQRSCG